MIRPSYFHTLLKKSGLEFFVGVPDSLMKDFCGYLLDRGDDLIAANEGGAVAIATGYHLATGKIPLVYMQNSGFGNIVNPVTSLADREVYSIPMILLIGWRGRPGTNDEPQHKKQGRTMEEQLKALELPYAILSQDEQKAETLVKEAVQFVSGKEMPYALLVPPGIFEKHEAGNTVKPGKFGLKREEALEVMIEEFSGDEVVVSTTGKTSRELYELREKQGSGHERDFLTVGSMGHASQIALGIALHAPDRTVACIDGDGAVLMHMGALAIIGQERPENFRHIIINNGAHESVGGQPTAGFSVDFGRIAEGCGYRKTFRAESKESLRRLIPEFMNATGPVMLEIMTETGARDDLGRPGKSPAENKKELMKFLSKKKS